MKGYKAFAPCIQTPGPGLCRNSQNTAATRQSGAALSPQASQKSDNGAGTRNLSALFHHDIEFEFMTIVIDASPRQFAKPLALIEIQHPWTVNGHMRQQMLLRARL